MVVGQGHPQLLLKPREVFGEAIRATGQAPVTLTLREVITFDKARVDCLTDWRGRQVRCHVLLGTKHHARAYLNHTSFGAFLDDLRIQQAWERSTAWVERGATRALSLRLVRFAVAAQYSALVLGQLITGEKRYVIIRYMRNSCQQHVCTGLITLVDHESQHQAPHRCKRDPYPGVPVGRAIDRRAGQMCFLRMHETPQLIELAFTHMQIVPQGEHNRAAVACDSIEPSTDRVFVHL